MPFEFYQFVNGFSFEKELDICSDNVVTDRQSGKGDLAGGPGLREGEIWAEGASPYLCKNFVH